MTSLLQDKIDDAIWIANSLFERGKTSGSTANMSFLHDGKVYISGTGTCFGTLSQQSFSVIDLDGNHLDGIKPSKEYPLHTLFYKHNPGVAAVIHTHSFYATLWSCYCRSGERNVIPNHTPYLRMKVGDIGTVAYAAPGSKELFQAFSQVLDDRRGYLLQNHGPVVGAADLFSAFYGLEELEESAHIAWELRNSGLTNIEDRSDLDF
ncbi:class II aldolase/adducin family protein [Caproiciproducens faecalis]|uniref:Class II aldolase/adducin family protein n=1 Tax=Caproiciproducens faecalis TaxID=2820301 RepID=A0ABS7DN04_9FIRM|nr:class II aldolase/adducin family protein [Caproiciproducens faecalis]MBW7572685.1 class II aldolase/adducin family protein [Caproiciproducens faecalis]